MKDFLNKINFRENQILRSEVDTLKVELEKLRRSSVEPVVNSDQRLGSRSDYASGDNRAHYKTAYNLRSQQYLDPNEPLLRSYNREYTDYVTPTRDLVDNRRRYNLSKHF